MMADEFAEKNAAQAAPVTGEIATAAKDIDIFAGYLRRLENPDPVLRTEAAGKGIKLYDEVARDPHAGSVLQQRILAVVGKEWEIVPAKSAKKTGRPAATPFEQVVADFVSEILEGCNFDQARQELLKGILYGFKAAEVIWTVKDGAVKVGKIIGKHPRRFCFTPERELRLLTPASLIEGEEVPPRKFIVFTYGDSDNPYGDGLGKTLWWPVWFKKNGIKFWLVFLEKFGMPTAVGKYPPGTLNPQKQTLLDAIDAIQNETGITIPETMAIEYLEASRAGNAQYEGFAEFMDRQISKAVLSQTLTTEIGETGSYAASQTHGEVRQEIVEADADLLDACLNETLIPWIVDYNFPGIRAYPKIKTYAAPKPGLTAQSGIDKTVTKDIGLPVPKQYFYDTYGYPAPQVGEETVGGTETTSALPGESGAAARFAERSGQNGPDAADALAERLATVAMPVTDALVAPLKRLVEKAGSLEELRENIIDLYGEMDPADLGVLIAQAMTAAEMAGRWEVAEETAGGKKKA